jgi:cytochrome c-type biogenesis protein CcmF
LPRSAWGTSLAHAGVGLTVIGIAATAWNAEGLGILKVGDTLSAGPYQVKLERVVPRAEANYRDEVATLLVSSGGRELGHVETMKRIYVTRNMPTTEAGIMTFGLSQVYASIGEIQADGSVGLHLFYKPFVLLIWLGAVVMAAGGALSLSDRRLRVGAPVRAKGLQAMPAPAE